MSTEVPEKSPTHILTKRYILGLSAVAMLSIAGQVAIQLSIKRQSSDAVVINVAGRQRMLSQKLAKATLAIQSSTDPRITDRYVQELQEAIDIWQKSHLGLQVGEPSLGLPGDNSATVEQLFADIERSHQIMLAAANGILTLTKNQPTSPAESANFSIFIQQILGQETHFVQGMDAIVGQYQQEAEARMAKSSQIEWFLLSITLVVLLLEAIFIFEPTVRQIQGSISELKQQKTQAAELSVQLEQQNTQLEASLEEAYSATRLKSEFLANISHELLTPMNASMGMTSLLLQTGLTPQQENFVQTIYQSGESLLQLIQDILDFSKIEAGQLQLENQPFDLRQCIEDSLEVVAADAANKELDLAYVIDAQTAPQIFGDRLRLQQILINLLTNAVKFTHQGEVVVSVSAEDLGNWSIPPQDPEDELFSERQYQEIQFSVRDTGIGIPKDRIHQLFRSFSQIDGSNLREYGGIGLGLAITQRLIQLMAGRLWVESDEGIGSTFSFTIAAAVVPNATDPLIQVQPVLQEKRLLIVDDHLISLETIRRQTEKWGMISMEATTGTEAIESIRQGNQFDAALLDMQMPQIDGLSLGRLIHQEKRLPDLKLVMMSAIGCTVKLPNSDFVGCLSKPIKVSQLYQVMMDLFAPLPTKPETQKPETQKPEKLADRLPLRILLAEDNVVNQKVALRMLSRLGYKADVAKNGLEAIAALEEKPYDLVLMDVQMPKMDGIEATKRICQQWGENISEDYATENKPWIIAITAGGADADRGNCLAAGMDDYLSKPINIGLLQTALEGLGERSDCQKLKSETGLVREDSVEMPELLLPKTGFSSELISTIAPDDLPTLDLTAIEKLRQELGSSEYPDLFKEIINLFLKNTPSLFADIKAAVQREDATALRYAVITLKGSTGNLGLRKMDRLCLKLQELGDRGCFEEASNLFSDLQAEFVRVQAEFQSRNY